MASSVAARGLAVAPPASATVTFPFAGPNGVTYYSQPSSETLTIAVQTSSVLIQGDVIGNLSSSLIDLATGAAYPSGLSGLPFRWGTLMMQTITGLQAGRRYLLKMVFQANSGRIWEAPIIITCPF